MTAEAGRPDGRPDDDVGAHELAFIQLGLNTDDMVATLRLYAELFGFDNAGAGAAWGDNLRLQGLGRDAYCLMWWMVGGAPFFQLELFQHGHPRQRPLPADWRPCDHGWTRYGISVADFDRVVRGLARRAVPILGQGGAAPARRLAFRDPHIGAIVEVLEGAAPVSPKVVYAAASVPDLAVARAFYGETLGLTLLPLDRLHAPEDEALWGLAGAEREGFLVDLPGGLLEISCYASPTPRPRPADYRVSDQGMMNACLGSRDTALIEAQIERVKATGRTIPFVFEAGGVRAAYVAGSGNEIELVAVPREMDAFLGFTRAQPFLADQNQQDQD